MGYLRHLRTLAYAPPYASSACGFKGTLLLRLPQELCRLHISFGTDVIVCQSASQQARSNLLRVDENDTFLDLVVYCFWGDQPI